MSTVNKPKHRPPIQPHDDPEKNPCLEESILSMECLKRNQDDKDRCELYFENYRLCRKFWSRVIAERKRQGIEPEVPPVSFDQEEDLQ